MLIQPAKTQIKDCELIWFRMLCDNNAKVLTLISRLQMNVGKIRLIEVCCKLVHGLVTKHIYFLDEMFSMWFAGAGGILMHTLLGPVNKKTKQVSKTLLVSNSMGCLMSSSSIEVENLQVAG
jgi:hypothetical protein